MSRSRLVICLLTPIALCACARVKAEASPCDSVQKVQLPNTTITNARIVNTGAFQMPRRGARASVEFFNSFNTLRAFCRVEATVTPSADSHINVEVWLPVTEWNGRFLGVGNGGFGGSIAYYRLGEAVNSGYAAGSTDTGHHGSSRDSRWSVGHPEKQTDFDYRAVHEMTVVAKAAIEAFYSKPASHSYFSSCSNGGRQGLMEAERFPTDYDGIMAGAPAMHWGFRTFVNGNLETFRARGGKVVIYHGSADAPQNSIDYLNLQRSHFGPGVADDFIQLYIVPGMGHCGSGDVPNDFGQWVRPNADAQNSMLKALEHWVEDSVRPQVIIATQWKTDGDTASGVARTMPLCPYPQRAGSDRQCH